MSIQNDTKMNNYPYKKINHFEEYLDKYLKKDYPANRSIVITDEKLLEYLKRWRNSVDKNKYK